MLGGSIAASIPRPASGVATAGVWTICSVVCTGVGGADCAVRRAAGRAAFERVDFERAAFFDLPAFFAVVAGRRAAERVLALGLDAFFDLLAAARLVLRAELRFADDLVPADFLEPRLPAEARFGAGLLLPL